MAPSTVVSSGGCVGSCVGKGGLFQDPGPGVEKVGQVIAVQVVLQLFCMCRKVGVMGGVKGMEVGVELFLWELPSGGEWCCLAFGCVVVGFVLITLP